MPRTSHGDPEFAVIALATICRGDTRDSFPPAWTATPLEIPILPVAGRGHGGGGGVGSVSGETKLGLECDELTMAAMTSSRTALWLMRDKSFSTVSGLLFAWSERWRTSCLDGERGVYLVAPCLRPRLERSGYRHARLCAAQRELGMSTFHQHTTVCCLCWKDAYQGSFLSHFCLDARQLRHAVWWCPLPPVGRASSTSRAASKPRSPT